VLATALLATMPMLLRGTSCGHDFGFHVGCWLDAHQSWREGIPYPHWAPSANYGAGEPRFIFYPPLEWMLGAAMGFVLPWQLVEQAMVFLLLAGCGLATRALAREFLDNRAATLAGCVALFSGYALLNAYERSDLAELTGGFWIALLLLYALRDRSPEKGPWQRAFDGSAAPLALSLAGAWLSNVPLGILTSYLLAAVAAMTALTRKSWAPVIRALAAVAVGLALAGIYLVPAVAEQHWVDVRQILDDPGYRIEANWLFSQHADPSMAQHDKELLRVSLITTAMLTMTFASLLLAWRRGRLRGKRGWWFTLAAIPALVLLMQLPASGWLWNLLPKLRFLQFPWRLLVAVQAPMGVLFAAAVWTDKPKPRAAVLAGTLMLFAVSTWIAGHQLFHVCDEDDMVSSALQKLHDGEGWSGYYEYEPPGADDNELAMDLPDACLVDTPTQPLGLPLDVDLKQWTPAQNSCRAYFDRSPESRGTHFVLDAKVPQAGFLVLKLRSYPAWSVRLNGTLQTGLAQRDDGLYVLPVEAGHVRVTADWTTTADIWWGRGLSMLGLLLLTGLCVIELRWKRARVSLSRCTSTSNH